MAVYGSAVDVGLNGGQIYIPGQTKLGAGDVYLGGTANLSDADLGLATRVAGNDRAGTQAAYNAYKVDNINNASSVPSTPVTPPVDTTTSQAGPTPAEQMTAAMNAQTAAQTAMYNQQATDQATAIRQAMAAQTQQADANKADYTNQTNAAIGTLNTERAKIPGQVTTQNNTASNAGMVNAQHIRNSLAQMGLLQSGENLSQQLANDISVNRNVNSNELAGQQADQNFGTQTANAQIDLATKVKSINDAIAVAQASGDENALMALKNAQNQIALVTAQNNTTMNNFQYQTSRDTNADNQWKQSFDAQKAQDNFNNAIAEGNLTGYYGGVHYVNGVAQTATTSNDTYGLQADIDQNPGKNIQLYIPGQTQLGEGDIFLGGTAVLPNDKLGGATRISGADRKATSTAYANYLSGINTTSSTGNTYGLAADVAMNPGTKLYIPGTTKLAAGDVFLGGTAVLSDADLGNATRVSGANRQATSDAYKNYLTGKKSMPVQTALPASIAAANPGATNVVKTAGGNYTFTRADGGKSYYAG